MVSLPNFDRRSFVIGAATAGAGLALGLKLPFGPDIAFQMFHQVGDHCIVIDERVIDIE